MNNTFYTKNKVLYNFFWVFCTAFIVFLDQITKYIVVSNMSLYEEIPVIKNFFNLHFVLNDGAGLGLLSNARWVFMTFTTLVILLAIVVLVIDYFKHPCAFFAVIFILGGGIGNMIDRIFLGEVIDFFQFNIKFFDFIFNVADIFITFGTILFLIYYLFLYKENVD